MRKDVEYAELLKKSFVVVWQHKVIWFFGILLAFMSGPSFNPGSNFSFGDISPNGDGQFAIDIENFFKSIGADKLILIAIAAILLLVVIGIVFFFLSSLIKGSLIHLVATANNGETPEARPALVVGRSKMLPIAGMTLLVLIPLVITILVLIAIAVILLIFAVIPAIESVSPIWKILLVVLAVLVALVAFLLLLLGSAIITIILDFAQRFIVLNDMKVVESVRSAWGMIKRHPSQSAISWLIMLAAGAAYSVVFLIVFAVLAIPVALLAFYSKVAAILVAIPLLLLMLLPAGYWTAFGSAFWTNVYMVFYELDGAGAEPSTPDELSEAGESEIAAEEKEPDKNADNSDF